LAGAGALPAPPRQGAASGPASAVLASARLERVKYFLILLIVVILFGGTRLPGLARGLGAGIRNFKDGLKGGDSEKPDKPKPS
jgi:TatA/E family protein of Tat protein translocase